MNMINYQIVDECKFKFSISFRMKTKIATEIIAIMTITIPMINKSMTSDDSERSHCNGLRSLIESHCYGKNH